MLFDERANREAAVRYMSARFVCDLDGNLHWLRVPLWERPKRDPLCRVCIMQTEWVPEMQAYQCVSPVCGALVTAEWLARGSLRARARSRVRGGRYRLGTWLGRLARWVVPNP